jgi:hypothetical protein
MGMDALKTERLYNHFSRSRKFPAESFPHLLCSLSYDIFCKLRKAVGLEYDFRLIRTFEQALSNMESGLKTLQDFLERWAFPVTLHTQLCHKHAGSGLELGDGHQLSRRGPGYTPGYKDRLLYGRGSDLLWS